MTLFRAVYLFLALNFVLPTLVYAFSPATAMGSFSALNELLGGGPLPEERSVFWWVLGVGNVGTLGFCCLLIASDLKRWAPAVVPLAFLKGLDAFMWMVAWIQHGFPAYGAATLLDFVTVWAIWWFPRRALRELAP